ncbi:hypothetical protein D499_0L00520 [Hanseniaspora uvarum DSM 2768]|nr:hypothetical protein D499_0L00520 [Hanseniaspora uvarum DSM 2768]
MVKEEIGLFKTSMSDFTAKLKDSCIKTKKTTLETDPYNQYESEFDNTAVDHESPTKKHKKQSRLTEPPVLTKKRTESVSSDKSTSDGEERELLSKPVALAKLTQAFNLSHELDEEDDYERSSTVELDCKDRFFKNCDFIKTIKQEKSYAEDKEPSLDMSALVNIEMSNIKKPNASPEETKFFDDNDYRGKEEDKEIGADLLMYLASSPSASQKLNKNMITSPRPTTYSLNIPNSQSTYLNSDKKQQGEAYGKYKNLNKKDYDHMSAPSTLLDYDGKTMLSSNVSYKNNNVTYQNPQDKLRSGMNTENSLPNKYKLLSTPIAKNRDYFGLDSSILRYATMSGGSVVHSNYEIPDVVLLSGKADLNNKLKAAAEDDKEISRVVEEDVSLKGLDETSDEETEELKSTDFKQQVKPKKSKKKTANVDNEEGFDINRLFVTPNISKSGVMSNDHSHHQMIDSVMLNKVSDAIHLQPTNNEDEV